MPVDQAQPPVFKKKVLDVGSGEDQPAKDHPLFQDAIWDMERLDINPAVKPDHVGSFTNLSQQFAADSFDAVLCSHAIEHLFAHEVLPTLKGFHQVLKPDGFLVITCPDIETVMAQVLTRGLDTVLYVSEAGPIAGLDILFGHTQSIARGNAYMAHKTGFTASRLGNLLIQTGFATAVVERTGWDLWGVAMRENADRDLIRKELCAGGVLLTF